MIAMVSRVFSILFVLQVVACPLWCALAESLDHHHAPVSDCEKNHENQCSVEPCFCTATALRPAERFVPRTDVVCPTLAPVVLSFQPTEPVAWINVQSFYPHGPPPEFRLPLLI